MKREEHIPCRLRIVWPMMNGGLIGLQAMLSALVLFGPARIEPMIAQQLTNRGLMFFCPEHDVSLYALGCVLAAFLMAMFSWLLQRRIEGDEGKNREQLTQRCAAQLLVITALTVVQLGQLFSLRWLFVFDKLTLPAFAIFLLALPTVASLALAFGVGDRQLLAAPKVFSRWLGAKAPVFERPRFSFHRVFDLLVPLLLCTMIYIPETGRLAGAIFSLERFHHWDFFAMGPTLAFHHGKALGTDTYAQYGVGWPLLYNALAGWMPITYGNFLRIGILYGCVWFMGVYGLLRLMLHRAEWAAAGVFLALSFQLFNGISPGEVMWRYPSSTVMRSTMDMWFFIALFFHLRSARYMWSLLAGVFVGLALFFETDTGIYLAVIFVSYWIFSLGLPKMCVMTRLLEGSMAFVAGLAVLLGGLAIASRGTLARREFWSGWTESLRSYGGGVSMLPVATVPDGTLFLFAFIIAVYLGVMGRALIALLRRDSTTDTVLLGCIGSHGLLTMLLFVGRSHPFNIYHVSVPFSIVVTTLLSGINERLASYGATHRECSMREFWHSITILMPWCVLAIVGLWLLLNPIFRNYPGALQSMYGGFSAKGLCLLHDPQDVCGLPPTASNYIAAFDATSNAIRQHAADGQSVAVLDETDTIFYLAAGVRPWWRYSPSFTAIIRRQELAGLVHELEEKGPKFVFIRGNDLQAQAFDSRDVWLEVHATVVRLYNLESETGLFQIWRRNGK